MFKEQMNKIKDLIVKNTYNGNETSNDKKKIENLVFFLVILIITLIVINTILKKGGTDKNNTSESPYKELAKETIISSSEKSSSDELEKKLETILSTMAGVGRVNVLVTYSKSSEIIAMYNENNSKAHTEETDSVGGTRVSEEENIKKEVIFTDEGRKLSAYDTNCCKSKN